MYAGRASGGFSSLVSLSVRVNFCIKRIVFH